VLDLPCLPGPRKAVILDGKINPISSAKKLQKAPGLAQLDAKLAIEPCCPAAPHVHLLVAHRGIVAHPGLDHGHEVVAFAGRLVRVGFVDANCPEELVVNGVDITDGDRPGGFLRHTEALENWSVLGARGARETRHEVL
jgi:hypothetical protein